MSVKVSTYKQGDVMVVKVDGEIDVSNAADLRNALTSVLDGPAGDIEIDLTNVSYIDSTGIGVLVGAAHRASDVRRGFAVAHPQRNVARVLGMLGVDEELGVRP